MALSASAKDYLSRFFPGPPSPLWETDPEFMELFANFALDEVVNQGDLDDAARMMAILAALLGCQGVEEYRVLLPAALRAGVTPVQVKEILYQSVAYLGIGRVRPFFSVTNQVLTEQGVALPLEPGSTTTAETRLPRATRLRWISSVRGCGAFRTAARRKAATSTAGWRTTASATTTPAGGWTISSGK